MHGWFLCEGRKILTKISEWCIIYHKMYFLGSTNFLKVWWYLNYWVINYYGTSVIFCQNCLHDTQVVLIFRGILIKSFILSFIFFVFIFAHLKKMANFTLSFFKKKFVCKNSKINGYLHYNFMKLKLKRF